MSGERAQDTFELEIRILPRRDQGYPVEITLLAPDGQFEFPRGRLAANVVPWVSSGDLVKDGQRLFETLLADSALSKAWAEARGRSPQRRIRLRIDQDTPELHALPWELLQDEALLLSASDSTPFSRYLPVALPWGGAVEERPIRVLAVLSNPHDLKEGYNLAQLDVEIERQIIAAALEGPGGELEVDFMESPITLEQLEEKLRQAAEAGNEYHVVHYTGHGAYSNNRGQAMLFLQDETGKACLIYDDALIGMLARQAARPRLVFLAACQSAVRSTADAFLGLGPKLVAAGVPAVVAMQDYVKVETARKLSAAFYRRLVEHGTVDLALNQARSALLTSGRPDAAVPVLFMRLKSGQLWSDEADARGRLLGAQAPKIFWTTMLSRIEDETCVPIIGPRVHGRWLPLPHEIARLWAEENGYPFGNKESLAHVAQYLDAAGGDDYSRDQLLRTLKKAFAARLPEGLRPRGKSKTLSALVHEALQQELPPAAPGEAPSPPGWARLAAEDPNEPHRVLARLNLPLYLTTNCDNFMFEALAAEGKKPRRDLCRWRDEPPSQETDDYEPTPEEPLVYHLFGSDEDMQSLLVSEDHYLDFMSSVLTKKDRIPYFIRGKLAESALMFVGYNLHDWEFRVVMRGLVKTLDFKFNYQHVAVQLEDVSQETEEAVRNFLQQYFQKAQISAFWGSTPQFVAALREQWENAGG